MQQLLSDDDDDDAAVAVQIHESCVSWPAFRVPREAVSLFISIHSHVMGVLYRRVLGDGEGRAKGGGCWL